MEKSVRNLPVSLLFPNYLERLKALPLTRSLSYQESLNLLISIDSDIDIFAIPSTKGNSLQSQLTDILQQQSVTDFQNGIVDMNRLAWVLSASTSHSSLWLTVKPLFAVDHISNANFATSLRRLLFLDIQKITAGELCNCRNHMDTKGLHASVCLKDGGTFTIHDSMKHCLATLIRYAGLFVKVEEVGAFKEAEPDKNKRTDVNVMNCPIKKTKHYIDYSNTSPIEGCRKGVFKIKTLNEAKLIERSIKIREKAKIALYSPLAKTQNEEFSAFVTESTGRFNQSALVYLKALSKIASELKRIEAPILYKWMLKRLSVTFQNSNANVIHNKVYRNTSHVQYDLPSMTVNSIIDSAYVR